MFLFVMVLAQNGEITKRFVEKIWRMLDDELPTDCHIRGFFSLSRLHLFDTSIEHLDHMNS